MKLISFPPARCVLAFLATSMMVGCSGRVASDDADVVDDLGAASQPDTRADAAPPSGVTAGIAGEAGSFTAAMVEEGQQIYAGAGICAADVAVAVVAPRDPHLTVVEWIIGDGEYELLVAKIWEGVSAAEATNPLGAIMPPKGGAAITEAQVRSVAAYVWTLSH